MAQGGTDDDRVAQDGWRLVQLAQLARDVEALARGVGGLLDADELTATGVASLDPGRRDALLNDVCALRDAAEQAGMIGGDLAPQDDALSVSVNDVGEAAATMLAEGSANAALVQLAVRLLHREPGFRALAEGIEVDPTGHVGQWGEVTIGDLLGAFRDASSGATAWVCASARIGADELWTDLDADALAHVTWALRHAPAR